MREPPETGRAIPRRRPVRWRTLDYASADTVAKDIAPEAAISRKLGRGDSIKLDDFWEASAQAGQHARPASNRTLGDSPAASGEMLALCASELPFAVVGTVSGRKLAVWWRRGQFSVANATGTTRAAPARRS